MSLPAKVPACPSSLSRRQGEQSPATPSLSLSGDSLSPAALHLRRLCPGPHCSQPLLQAPASVAPEVSSSALHSAVAAGTAPPAANGHQAALSRDPRHPGLCAPCEQSSPGHCPRGRLPAGTSALYLPPAEGKFNAFPAKGGSGFVFTARCRLPSCCSCPWLGQVCLTHLLVPWGPARALPARRGCSVVARLCCPHRTSLCWGGGSWCTAFHHVENGAGGPTCAVADGHRFVIQDRMSALSLIACAALIAPRVHLCFGVPR